MLMCIVYVYTARSGQRETPRWREFHFVVSHSLKVGQSCLESWRIPPHFKHKSGGFTLAWPSCISLAFISGSFPFVLSECAYTNNQRDTSASDYVWFSSKATWSSLLAWRWYSPITTRSTQPIDAKLWSNIHFLNMLNIKMSLCQSPLYQIFICVIYLDKINIFL